jgi:hypothetical protein
MTPSYPPLAVDENLLQRDELAALETIRQQLDPRRPISNAFWGAKIAQRVARVLGDVCAEVSGWPVNKFYPDDPVRVMVSEDMADVEVVAAMHGEFGLDIEPDEMRHLESLTFGQAVDYLTARIENARNRRTE